MEEIIRRLRSRDHSRIKALKESMPIHGIKEEEELPDEEVETPEEEEFNIEDELAKEDSEDLSPEDSEDEEPENPDNVEAPSEDEKSKENINPLDNQYAVNYHLGQEVTLVYSNGSKSKLSGTIEGYDKEGFYRIKWSNGKTTSGLTDIALADMVEDTNENKCVCGSTEFVNENKNLVCDKCGRVIRESYSNQLEKADKSRPKGQRLVRSQAHDVSTSLPECDTTKKSIADSIRKAFTKKSINENEEDSDVFVRLVSKLDNEFWTRSPEMLEDIRALGYDVLDANAEYVVVAIEDEEGEDHQMQIPVGGTARTLTLDFARAEIL